ncbi:MAG: calcium/proton exchanger [Dehalococcoidia bacterium]|nr:calcium/proton exchanger [Dehalococcoidia bacterium]
MRYIYGLLALIPVAIAFALLGFSSTIVFIAAAAALVPLSALIGKGTEDVAAHAGQRIGGLLNVTMGNAAELIITIVALRQGLTALVRASIAGSILGNVLLVLGSSLLVGGLRHGRQKFDPHIAGVSATMMTLAVIVLSAPAFFTTGSHAATGNAREALNIGVAVVLLAVYVLYIVYTIILHQPGGGSPMQEAEPKDAWSLKTAVAVLAAATLGAVVMSELLVRAVESVVDQLGTTELFLGVMIVPLVGNAAEHWSAILAAAHDKMDLSVGISIGSSLQIALFVAPLLVLLSLVLGQRLQLEFNQYELASLIAAVAIASFVSFDGESNWVEGAQLLAVYVVLGLGFVFLAA